MRRLSRDDLTVGMRFLSALPGFLRTPLAVDEMRAIVRDRFARREARFLARFAEACRAPGSPYARLMEHAGATQDDVAASVRRDGGEGTLTMLCAAGVRLAGDEYKGRRPVVRGSLAFTVDPATLVNPRAVVHGLSESSGSRGARTPVPIDLGFVRDHAVNTHLALDAHGGRDWSHAHHGVPGGTSVTNPLEFAKGGRPPVRWFTPIDVAAPTYNERYLCQRPQERLFFQGRWQEGLLPKTGVHERHLAQYERFEALVQELRDARDASGRRAFSLPMEQSSPDPGRQCHVPDPVRKLFQQRSRHRALAARARQISVETVEEHRDGHEDGGQEAAPHG